MSVPLHALVNRGLELYQVILRRCAEDNPIDDTCAAEWTVYEQDISRSLMAYSPDSDSSTAIANLAGNVRSVLSARLDMEREAEIDMANLSRAMRDTLVGGSKSEASIR